MSQVYGMGAAVPHPEIEVRRITTGDVIASLREGLADFLVSPTHFVFLCLVYPIMGVVIGVSTSGGDTSHLLFPLVTGFALVGPLAGVGLYEVSRRRERGMATSWRDMFKVLSSPALGSIIGVGVLLLAIFGLWIWAAGGLYEAIFAETARHASVRALLSDILTTREGLTLLLVGNAVGFVFAAVVLSVSLVSLPLLLDKEGSVGFFEALRVSVRATRLNVGPVLFWGFVVAGLLLVGSVPLFVGLAVVLPVLGHSTWRLYRCLVS